MLKKSLIAIALVAFVATSAFAGWNKTEKPWPCAPIPQKVCNIDVMLDMPYFIKLYKEPIKIQLEQVGDPGFLGSLTFEGYAKDKDGNPVKAKSNFNAKLSLNLIRTDAGKLLQGDGGKWSKSITPDTLVALTETVLSIYVKVVEVDMSAIPVCQNTKVADLEVLVIPQ